jgi:hypothetical protein
MDMICRPSSHRSVAHHATTIFVPHFVGDACSPTSAKGVSLTMSRTASCRPAKWGKAALSFAIRLLCEAGSSAECMALVVARHKAKATETTGMVLGRKKRSSSGGSLNLYVEEYPPSEHARLTGSCPSVEITGR